MQIFPEQQKIICSDTLTLIRSGGEGETLVTRMVPLYDIEEVTVGGEEVPYEYEKGKLTIGGIPDDKVVELALRYSGVWSLRSEFSAVTRNYALMREHELFPMIEGEYLFVRLSVEIPSSWRSVTVGDLAERRLVGDRAIERWESEDMLPEIGWIWAGEARAVEDSPGAIRYSWFGNARDSASIAYVMPMAKEAIEYYSSQFTPYRFSKFSIIEIDDWVAGGNVLAIAAPSFVLVKGQAFTTSDRFNRIESILAHEIAHEWWPLTVFIDRKDAAFLAEGLCEYSSILFHREKNLTASRDTLSRHPLLRPLLSRAQSGNDMPLQKLTDLRNLTTHYLKAAYVHHMLRSLIGEDTYERLLMTYARNYSARRASLENFQAVAESLSGTGLGWFFDQWVRKRGIPRVKIYNVHSQPSESLWRTRGRVRIIGYEKFRVSGQIEVSRGGKPGGGTERLDFTLGTDSAGHYQNDLPFEFLTGWKPELVRFDPDGEILKMQKLPVKLSDLREASDGVMIVGSGPDSDLLRSLAVRDSTEMQKKGWGIRIVAEDAATLHDLQGERIFIYGKPGENRLLADVTDKFILKFSNDSLVLGNEPFYDSSAALIEAIDNPFFPNGLIVRIMPFSRNAAPELLPHDYSWIVTRGRDRISSGVNEVEDEDLVVKIR